MTDLKPAGQLAYEAMCAGPDSPLAMSIRKWSDLSRDEQAAWEVDATERPRLYGLTRPHPTAPDDTGEGPKEGKPLTAAARVWAIATADTASMLPKPKGEQGEAVAWRKWVEAETAAAYRFLHECWIGTGSSGEEGTASHDYKVWRDRLYALWQSARRDAAPPSLPEREELDGLPDAIRDLMPVTQDFESTEVCDALERAAKLVEARLGHMPEGEG